MIPAQEKLFDDAVLRVLDSNRSRLGLSAEAIGHLVAQFGFEHPLSSFLLDRLAYLVIKKLAEEVAHEVHRANRTWRITDAGIQYLDCQG
jgi:hypothetical protein